MSCARKATRIVDELNKVEVDEQVLINFSNRFIHQPIKFILSGLKSSESEFKVLIIMYAPEQSLEAIELRYTFDSQWHFMLWLEYLSETGVGEDKPINWFGVDTTFGAIEFTEG